MYTTHDFKTKKSLKEAIARGDNVGVFSPGAFQAPENGDVSVEGPHYPKPHTWYARVRVKDGRITKVLS